LKFFCAFGWPADPSPQLPFKKLPIFPIFRMAICPKRLIFTSHAKKFSHHDGDTDIMQSIVHNQPSQSGKKRKLQQAVILATSIAVVQATLNTTLSFLSREEPRPKRTSPLKGGEYIRELLESAHPGRIQEVLRMRLKPFEALCNIMREEGHLHDTKHIDVEEQLAMFLHVVSKSAGFRDVEERFQHSGETVHRYFHTVLNGLLALVPKYIKHPITEIPDAITSNPKFYPFLSHFALTLGEGIA
jgi:hypothetical protein